LSNPTNLQLLSDTCYTEATGCSHLSPMASTACCVGVTHVRHQLWPPPPSDICDIDATDCTHGM